MNRSTLPKTISKRVDVAPEGGILASRGFYTRQVQLVVRRWEGKVDQTLIEEYFLAVAKPIFDHHSIYNVEIRFHLLIREHWKLIFELGEAISRVVEDDTNIDKWLLTQPWSVAINGEWQSWDSIAEFIGKRVGQRLSTGFANTVRQRAKRLRLLTPPQISAEFLAVTKRYGKM